jgi:hypothetical protein
MHAQSSSQNLLACPITNSNLISKVLNGSTSNITNELLKFGNSVGLVGLPVCWLSSMDVWPALNQACHSNTRVWLMLSSPNACLIIARVSVTLFLRFAQNLMHTRCSLVGAITKSHQARYTTPNKRKWKISASTWMREILYTDSQDMLVLPSTVALRYYNCCTDGSTSPGNYGYHLICPIWIVCEV